jgi:hypothetical protein
MSARGILRRTLVWLIILVATVGSAELIARSVFRWRFSGFLCCGHQPDPIFCELGMAYRNAWVEFPETHDPPYAIWRYDPVLGHRLRANLRERNYKGGLVSSNSDGARGTVEYPLERDGKTRIVAIGDSFTFGQEVDDRDVWTAVLERLDPHREVINLGASAYGRDQVLLSLREQGLKYHPDVVLLGYFTDDGHRSPYEFVCGPKPVFRKQGNSYRLENVPVPKAEEMSARLRRRSLLYMLGRWMVERLFGLGERTTHEDMDRLDGFVLDEIVSSARGAGARAVFVRLPSDVEVRERHHDRFFEDYCRSRGIDCLDLTPVMVDADERSGHQFARLYMNMQHYSAAGNRLAAEAIDRYLRDHLSR